uniref:Uncharacterized protein n=1 Tax=Rhizophora mucronata TaxID=61149 RepID=A0A2P2P5X6_RHIMU
MHTTLVPISFFNVSYILQSVNDSRYIGSFSLSSLKWLECI